MIWSKLAITTTSGAYSFRQLRKASALTFCTTSTGRPTWPAIRASRSAVGCVRCHRVLQTTAQTLARRASRCSRKPVP